MRLLPSKNIQPETVMDSNYFMKYSIGQQKGEKKKTNFIDLLRSAVNANPEKYEEIQAEVPLVVEEIFEEKLNNAKGLDSPKRVNLRKGLKYIFTQFKEKDLDHERLSYLITNIPDSR